MDENETEKQSQMEASFHNEDRYIDPECYNDDLEEVENLSFLINLI